MMLEMALDVQSFDVFKTVENTVNGRGGGQAT